MGIHGGLRYRIGTNHVPSQSQCRVPRPQATCSGFSSINGLVTYSWDSYSYPICSSSSSSPPPALSSKSCILLSVDSVCIANPSFANAIFNYSTYNLYTMCTTELGTVFIVLTPLHLPLFFFFLLHFLLSFVIVGARVDSGGVVESVVVFD